MSKLPILHVCDSPFVGGPERQILGQCTHIDPERFHPIVASFAESASRGNDLIAAANELGIRTVQLSDGKVHFPRAVRQLCSAIRREGIRAVIGSGFKANFTASCACALTSTPYVAYFHGHTGATPRVRLYEALDLKVMRRSRLVIAVCEAAADALGKSGVSGVTVLPNAVDSAEIAAEGTRTLARDALGIGHDETVIGTSARLSVEKGLVYLIDAAPRILRYFPSARFVVIGDGPLKIKLRRQASGLCIEDRFIFTGFRADSIALTKAFDVFVLPSLRENLPVSLLEAMACGVPIVATDVGGVREVLAPARVEPIPPRSSTAIAEAVLAVLQSASFREVQSSALLTRVGDFSFERQANLLTELLLHLAAPGGAL